jgi:hypothetical protein
MANENPNCLVLLLDDDGDTIVSFYSNGRCNTSTPKSRPTINCIILTSKVLGFMGLKVCSFGIFQTK